MEVCPLPVQQPIKCFAPKFKISLSLTAHLLTDVIKSSESGKLPLIDMIDLGYDFVRDMES